jgi:hypothetical protein
VALKVNEALVENGFVNPMNAKMEDRNWLLRALFSPSLDEESAPSYPSAPS